jgi:ABC-type nitrate/sulfonate/bicarbonate transport system permease component
VNRHRLLLGVLGVLILLILWGIASYSGYADPLFLPSPVSVILITIENLGSLAKALYVSLLRLLTGFVVGALIGVASGIPVGAVKALQRTVLPVVNMIRSIPNLAWIPLALVWFGIGDSSKVFVIALAAFFPVFTNTFVGVKNIDPILFQAALTFGATRSKMFHKVLLPATFGDIFVGLKVGLQAGIVALVATEVVASTAGLGYVMNQATSFFKSSLVVSVIIIIGILGSTLTGLMVRIERRYVRWHVGIAESQ